MRAIRSCNGIAEQPSSSIAGVSNPATSASEPGSERRAKAPWQNHNGVWIRCSYRASGFPWPQYTTGVVVDDVVVGPGDVVVVLVVVDVVVVVEVVVVEVVVLLVVIAT